MRLCGRPARVGQWIGEDSRTRTVVVPTATIYRRSGRPSRSQCEAFQLIDHAFMHDMVFQTFGGDGGERAVDMQGHGRARAAVGQQFGVKCSGRGGDALLRRRRRTRAYHRRSTHPRSNAGAGPDVGGMVCPASGVRRWLQSQPSAARSPTVIMPAPSGPPVQSPAGSNAAIASRRPPLMWCCSAQPRSSPVSHRCPSAGRQDESFRHSRSPAPR